MEKREFHFSSPDSHIFLGFLSTVFGFVLFFMFFPFFYQINFFSNLAIAEESLFSRFYDIR